MHFAKAEHLLAVLGNVLLCLNAGKLLALGAEVNVLFLAALSYLAALAELIVVGGYCAAAVTYDILGIEYRSPMEYSWARYFLMVSSSLWVAM